MRCKRPRKIRVGYSLRPATSSGYAAVPCGVCLHCRIDQARVWKNRLLLEQVCHGDSCFVTLTYDDEHIPDPPHVIKKDLQKFIRRLRNQTKDKIRYFGVGEYGDKSFRPHYHIVIFGIGILHELTIKRCWKKCDPDLGIDIGELNSGSASYITGYITKKTLKKKGEHPVDYGKRDEFVLSSKRPGIGKPAIDKIVEKLKGDKRIEKQYYTLVRQNGKKMPLGRYLKDNMNRWQEIGYTEKMLKFFAGQKQYEKDRTKLHSYKKYKTRGEI